MAIKAASHYLEKVLIIQIIEQVNKLVLDCHNDPFNLSPLWQPDALSVDM